MPQEQRRPTTIPRFRLDDDAAFYALLRDSPRTIVLWSGADCGWSARCEADLPDMTPPPGWKLAIREVEHGGEGPVGAANGIDITPTAIAYLGERETARIEAIEGVGLAQARLQAWLTAIA